jgi:hypothetical protein
MNLLRTAIHHDGHDFTVTCGQYPPGVAVGPDNKARLAHAVWQVATDGYPPYMGPERHGDEGPDFPKQLLAEAWPKMRAGKHTG